MSVTDEDINAIDPLAGIDLNAWQPPAPGPAPADAILARAQDGTRVDVASAVEVDGAATKARPRRTRWIAIGVVLGAAAAVMLAIAVWPATTVERVVTIVPAPPPVPRPIPTPATPDHTIPQPAGTVGPSVDECKVRQANHDWTGLAECPAFKDLADREAINQRAYDDVKAAVAANDAATAKRKLALIAKDSVYYASARAALDDLVATKYDFSDACNTTKLVDAARDAASENNWKKMLRKAQAAEDCDRSSAEARKYVLLAACKLGKKTLAEQYWMEFADNAGIEKACVGVIDSAPLIEGGCDANALLDDARTAGGNDQWSKMLAKAELSNKCSPSKIARQLALLAACQLGNKDKALKYWKEFENNSGMQQRCIGVVK